MGQQILVDLKAEFKALKLDINSYLKIDASKAKGGKAEKKIDAIRKLIHEYVTLTNKITEVEDDFDMDEVERVTSKLKRR